MYVYTCMYMYIYIYMYMSFSLSTHMPNFLETPGDLPEPDGCADSVLPWQRPALAVHDGQVR